jgi:hypothetical protein
VGLAESEHAMTVILYAYGGCGHVGRTSESNSRRAKVQAFIRVAEARDCPVLEVPKSCPDCERNH